MAFYRKSPFSQPTCEWDFGGVWTCFGVKTSGFRVFGVVKGSRFLTQKRGFGGVFGGGVNMTGCGMGFLLKKATKFVFLLKFC
jgi:hypothetical protein